MMSLSNEQKHLLFDYCLGLTSKQEAKEAEAIISSNKDAAEIHSRLKSVISPLNAVEPQSCPDELAERMMMRLTEFGELSRAETKPAGSGQERLTKLLEEQQSRFHAIKFGIWRNFSDVVAVAAVIMLMAAVLVPSMGFARQKYWQNRCQVQLGSIYQGLSDYISDHNGRMPAVARQAGNPWWKVGYQGSENHSSSRPIWLLVKNNYVEPKNFVCPAAPKVEKLRLDTLQVQNYNDFPSRMYVSFSFRICCPKDNGDALRGRKVLMADMNPLAEKLPTEYSSPLKIRLTEEMLNFNSVNHNRRGQNVMLGDGSIQFTKTRYVGDSQDDIFALQGMQCGVDVNGCEVPSCETDTLVAP
jgi:hypothetical protein